MSDPDFYPGTQVRRNKLGYTDAHALEQAEAIITAGRMAELSERPIAGDFTFEHLQEIHRYLLGDLYEWAGELRTMRTFAGNTSIEHDSPESIEAGLIQSFAKLADADYLRGRDHEDFKIGLAEHWGDLTLMHPFIDGNSRTQKVFIDHLARDAGWAIDWREVNVGALQAARTFSFVDEGKILGDVLAPVIVEKDSIPENVVAAASRDTSTGFQEHWVAMIEHAENRFDEQYTWSTQPATTATHQAEPTSEPVAEHHELPEYESSWQQPYWAPETGHGMTTGHTMPHLGPGLEGPRL